MQRRVGLIEHDASISVNVNVSAIRNVWRNARHALTVNSNAKAKSESERCTMRVARAPSAQEEFEVSRR